MITLGNKDVNRIEIRCLQHINRRPVPNEKLLTGQVIIKREIDIRERKVY